MNRKAPPPDMAGSATPELSVGGHIRAVSVLGVPLIGSHVAQHAIHLIDAVMLGRYDVEALAAEVLGGTLFFVLFIMGSGFAFGVMPMVAEAMGRGAEAEVRRATRMGLWISLAFGVLTLPLFLLSEPIFIAIGQEAEISRLAGEYLSVLGISILPALMVMVLKNYLAALEKTQVVLWITLIALPLNALLNYPLIFGAWGVPEMGVLGAAIGSLLATTFSMLALGAYIWIYVPQHEIFSRIWRPDWEAFAAVFKLGWPIGVSNLAEVGLFAATSMMAGWLGTIVLAGHGIALQITSLTFMVHLGLSNAATVRAGRAMGRGDGAGLKRGARVVIVMSICVALITAALFVIFGETFVGMFLSADDPDRASVVAVGGLLLIAAAVFQLVDAAQVMGIGLLRGLHDTRVPMVIAAVSYWIIGVPVSYLLGFTFGYGGVGIWLGLAVGLGFAGVAMMWRFWRVAAPKVGPARL
ncbi:MATE family efflux transporter [Rhodobacterales bacterium 59_46_T64]|nr:MATE family efflux transporter [Rhodobacterales bacterium 59_46_T64]